MVLPSIPEWCPLLTSLTARVQRTKQPRCLGPLERGVRPFHSDAADQDNPYPLADRIPIEFTEWEDTLLFQRFDKRL
jgi:hypothetical protein